MRTLMTALVCLLFVGSAHAQQPPRPAPAPAPAPRPAPAPAPAQPAPPAAPAPVAPATAAPSPVVPVTAPLAPPENADPINVRYEIAVRDTGGSQPGTKTVTMTATTGATSSVRATGTVAGRGSNPLSVDVMPSTVREGKVHTYIGFDYVPQSPGTAGPPPLAVRQTLHVWLDSGKPMVVSQATDPNSDRRLEVTVTATIVR